MEQNRNKGFSDENRNWQQNRERFFRDNDREPGNSENDYAKNSEGDRWGNFGSSGSYGREQSGSGYGSNYENQGNYNQQNENRWQEDENSRYGNRRNERPGYGNSGGYGSSGGYSGYGADFDRGYEQGRGGSDYGWTAGTDMGYGRDRSRDFDHGNMNRGSMGYSGAFESERGGDEEWSNRGNMGRSRRQQSWGSENMGRPQSGWGSSNQGNMGSSSQNRDWQSGKDENYGNYGTQGGFGGSFSSIGASQGWQENAQSGGHRGKGPKGYQRSQERIKEDICDRLTDDDSIDASDVEINVTNGEVILSGSVSDKQTKRRIEDMIESMSGVKNVQNNLRVSSMSTEENKTGGKETSTGSAPSKQPFGSSQVKNEREKMHHN